MWRSLCVPLFVVNGVGVPTSMTAVQASGTPCSSPDWTCLTVNSKATVPTPTDGEALVKVSSSSVNPVDIDLVEPFCVNFGCIEGTLGQDVAGTVVAVGTSCDLAVGSEVWGVTRGAYAEYALITCNLVSQKPKSLTFMPAGTIPTIGLTALQLFQKSGAPWTSNPSVVVTSGQGGTGYMAVQLAKSLGAANVTTAATGPGIDMVTALGADNVVDYEEEDIFDALANDSVDIVCDNIGFPGTADKALRVLRSGGIYILLPGGHGGSLSDKTKAGVEQINFGFMQPNEVDLSTLAALFDEGKLRAEVMQAFDLVDVPLAFTRKLGGHILSKISVAVALEDSIFSV